MISLANQIFKVGGKPPCPTGNVQITSGASHYLLAPIGLIGSCTLRFLNLLLRCFICFFGAVERDNLGIYVSFQIRECFGLIVCKGLEYYTNLLSKRCEYHHKLQSCKRKVFHCVLILSLAATLHATNARISNGIQLATGARNYPCQTATCIANSPWQMVYDAKTSASGCNQIWGMTSSGGTKVNISALLYAAGLGSVTRNQGNPVLSMDGNWLMLGAQKPTSIEPCTDYVDDPGVAVNQEIWIVSTSTLTNFAKIAAVTFTDLGEGWLHPQFARDGQNLYVGYLEPIPQSTCVVVSPVGTCGCLVTASFVPGTPPSITNIVSHDPNGDGTCHLNWYEPADDGPEINTGVQNVPSGTVTSCRLYYTTDTTNTSPTLATIGIAWFDACDGNSTGFISNAFTPTSTGGYNEFFALPTPHPDTGITTSTAFYQGPAKNPSGIGLDLVMAAKDSGAGATELTGYNNVQGPSAWPEYAPCTIVSDPRWSADATFITITVVSGCKQPGQAGYSPEVVKYSVNDVPFQLSGTAQISGTGSYK